MERWVFESGDLPANALLGGASGPPAWAPSTHYIPNQVVTNSGDTYLCINDHTSGGSFVVNANWFAVAATKIPLTQKAAASGVATLDTAGLLPVGQLPIIVTPQQFGAVGDFFMDGHGITISGGSLNQGTMSSIPATLQVGMTMVIAGLTAPVVVQSISGLTVTFTGNASGAVAAPICAWGTDNTTALNNFIAFMLAAPKSVIAVWPTGRYLITGTIGRLDGPTTGYAGVQIFCGGAAANSGRLSGFGTVGGTSLIWGGVAGGTMMQWNRVSNLHWAGGLSIVGQPSYDPSGFATFGNRAGLGYEVSQPGVASGTGYHFFDDLVLGDISLGFQFGENVGDNNTDTSRFTRLVAQRCSQVGVYLDQQSLGQNIGFLHHLNCGRGILTNAGQLTIDNANFSACGLQGATLGSTLSIAGPITSLPLTSPSTTPIPAGATINMASGLNAQTFTLSAEAPRLSTSLPINSVTPNFAYPSGTQITGIWQLECNGGISGVAHVFGAVRPEQNTGNVILVGSTAGGTSAAAVVCGIFHDEGSAGFATGQELVHVNGGGIFHADQVTLASFDATYQPFYMDASSSKTGKIDITDLAATGSGGVIVPSQLFNYNANAVVDLTVRSIRDLTGRTYNPIQTKLARGKMLLYATTTTTTAVQMSILNSVHGTFGYAPRIPKGYAILNIGIIGDRGDGTFSVFQRQLQVWRTSGAATIVSTTTVGTDSAQGTDAISSITIDATFQILDIKVGGTTAKTIAWTAVVDAAAFTAAADL